MIYEMRATVACRAACPMLLKRFDTITLKLWEKHGIRQAGFCTTLVGESNHELTYFLACESMAEREKKWGRSFDRSGMGRRHAPRPRKTRSDRLNQFLKPTVRPIQLLAPTAFSSVK